MAPLATTVVAGSLGPGVNPVTIPEPDAEGGLHPVTDEPGTWDRDRGVIVTDGVSGQQTGHPPTFDPVTTGARLARAFVAFWRGPEGTPPLGNVGTRSSFASPMASTPSGTSLSNGDPARGNSWRLLPDPWDGPAFTANVGSAGGVE